MIGHTLAVAAEIEKRVNARFVFILFLFLTQFSSCTTRHMSLGLIERSVFGIFAIVLSEKFFFRDF